MDSNSVEHNSESYAGDQIRKALAQLPATQGQANALNDLRILEAALRGTQEQLETLREAAQYAEDQLRMFGKGADVLKARHRLEAALSNPASDPEPCDYCKQKGREWTPECEDNKSGRGFGIHPEQSPAKSPE